MLLRLDEIGENYENFKAKVISFTSNKAEQTRRQKKERAVPMELDYVCGSELCEEENGTMWMKSGEIDDATTAE